MEHKTIRFGIIGTNAITHRFLSGAKEVKEFELTAVYSRSLDKAKEFSEKYGVKNTFTNLEEMAKSDLIDAVYIASPNALHSSQAILFLNHKKNVLSEKAFASNGKEAKEMIEAAKNNGVLLMEAMKTTILPNFKVIKENLHKIGKVRRYFGSYCQYSSRYDKYKEGIVLNAFNPELSNGALMDIGVYCIYPMVALFGKPKEVKANALMLDSGVDGEGSALFKYEDMDGVVMYSKICDSYLPSEIQGESGSIIIEKINSFNSIKIKYKNGKEEDISLQQHDEDMCYELQEFIDLIKEEKTESEINTFDTSLSVMEIMDEVRRQIGLVFPADK
ncbi:Predicted dehydrogenase [Clostridium amylolyticum]|uniref:Predicted dehydrogenase n=1 Tax=Clostridium amylolyticum TaxID=1121298 RepID=A0A1M6FC08_9CLOT|nr:Gfo/Idh/MocA family oxidoreductase [Clostridium amylolyticum]SHI95250.1 Predicted dehydrogenase [Clostridium amylolyticum]